MSPTYNELNKAWNSTCRALLGAEAGELKDLEEWLVSYYAEKTRIEKSAKSGKDVVLLNDMYCKDANFIGYDEIDIGKKFEPLDINDVKDIDSIVEALQERFTYSGNIVLGSSRNVEYSTNVDNSSFVLNSAMIDESQYIADSSYCRNSKYLFGVWGGTNSSHLIRGWFSTKNQRCFEHCQIKFSSDIFYSAGIEACNDCMFSFNLQGKRKYIGNREMQPDKYVELKKKLLAEIIDELKAKRNAPSLLSIMSGFPKRKAVIKTDVPAEKFAIAPIQTAFNKTFNILLKKEPGDIEDYKDYLMSAHFELTEVKPDETSSNEELFLSRGYKTMFMIKHRAISFHESSTMTENSTRLEEIEAEGLSLHNTSALEKIAFMPLDYRGGKNENVGKSQFALNARDCYFGASYIESKSSAFCWWPRESSYAFGCSSLLASSFCINSHYSTRLTRSFEVDGCNGCSDIYFSHNCDNVHDSMFCFNKKNIRNAIGNAELPLEQYKKAKDTLVKQIADELVSKKNLRWDIYNVGCYKR